jgi:peptide/nickel transport system permease protein
MVPTTLGIALVVFTIFHAAPGDPATVMIGAGTGGQLGQDTDVEGMVEKFRRDHGLDRSLFVQFFDYVGPLNLDRDGIPWFSSPHTERATRQVELSDGTEIDEGKVMAIGHLPKTSDEDAERFDAARVVLSDDEAGEAAWSVAVKTLAEGGDEARPALLSGLHLIAESAATRQAGIGRLIGALETNTGAEFSVPKERLEALGDVARIRACFAWYFANGGFRVQNTGADWWGGLFVGDLRREMQSGREVGPELVKRLKVTVPLALSSVLLSYLFALPLGIFSARNHGKRRDGLVTIALFVLFAIPTFWAGLMLILTFGKTGLDLLPVVGLHDKDAADLGYWAYGWDTVLHSILPVLTMTYSSLAYLSRQMRAGMMDTLQQDYIRTARAKGLSETVVIYKHALRNSMIPVLTLLASVLPILIGGSIIIEKVFDVPGMGRYAFDGLLKRDFNIIMATTILVGVMTQVGILLSDITYSIVDPRIRNE